MNELEKCRAELDIIDDSMREAFAARMKIAARVAKYKEENNLPIFDEAREAAMIARGSEKVDAEIRDYYVEFLRSLLKASKAYQAKLLERSVEFPGK